MLFQWNDDATWKRFVLLAQEGQIDDIRDALAEYSDFVVYHGCRPDDPSVYYQQGLKIADVGTLNRRAAEIFLTPEFPGVTKAKLLQAIDRDSRSSNGKLYVVLDKDEFMEFSPHYLIYGSEYIWRLANQLTGRGMVSPNVLKRFGIPTLFEIHVPAHELPSEQLQELSKYIYSVCNDGDIDERPSLAWGFIFQEPLPGSWIKKHIHPEEIIDRTCGFRSVYRYKDDRDGLLPS